MSSPVTVRICNWIEGRHGQPFEYEEICQALPDIKRTRVSNMIHRLIASDRLRRIGRGVWIARVGEIWPHYSMPNDPYQSQCKAAIELGELMGVPRVQAIDFNSKALRVVRTAM